jgi:hypothetical protein
MLPKIKITIKTLEILNPKYTAKDLEQALEEWWVSRRIKPKGGLRLTKLGYQAMVQAGIKEYQISFERPIKTVQSQLAIWMDQLIDCPFYFSEKELRVFGEHMALQLVLFSGNVLKFGRAKKRKSKTA